MSDYTRVRREGFVLNQRTLDMLKHAEKLLGYSLYLAQGSYNAGGVSASAGTHDGGGAVDVSRWTWEGSTKRSPTEIVRALRKSGFAAWHRLPSQGPWVEHIHAIALDDREASDGAKRQMADYRARENGLANSAPDDGPRVEIRTWEQIKRAEAEAAYDPSKPPGPADPPTLRAGSTKKLWVKHLQYLLNQCNGAHAVDLKVDGVYGTATQARVRDFRRRNKIFPYTTVAGSRVWKKL